MSFLALTLMAIVFAIPGVAFLEAGWRLAHDYESDLLYEERHERANHRYAAGGLWLFGVFVPTENGLPITEASRLQRSAPAATE